MAAVTASTNIDNPKIDFAGVETGANMLVGLAKAIGSAKVWDTIEEAISSAFRRVDLFIRSLLLPGVFERVMIGETVLSLQSTHHGPEHNRAATAGALSGPQALEPRPLGPGSGGMPHARSVASRRGGSPCAAPAIPLKLQPSAVYAPTCCTRPVRAVRPRR